MIYQVEIISLSLLYHESLVFAKTHIIALSVKVNQGLGSNNRFAAILIWKVTSSID